MTYPIQEHQRTINNVEGRAYTVHAPHLINGTLVHRNQRWASYPRPVTGYGKDARITAEIRFDDACKNGHQSFSITAYIKNPRTRAGDYEACGCLHDEIARVFPELAPLIKWHLMDTTGPLHYIANTLYHAGDRDHHGLKKGESRQIKNGRTGGLCWVLRSPGTQYHDGPTPPPTPEAPVWEPLLRVGEGKARDLDAARRSACWPEATDAELCAPRDELRATLEARLPAMVAAFRADMDAIGMLWELDAPVTPTTNAEVAQ